MLNSQQDMPFVSYEEPEDDLDDFNRPKQCRYDFNHLIEQCNCMKEERKQTPAIPETLDLDCIVRKFVHLIFAADKEEWKRNKKNGGVS